VKILFVHKTFPAQFGDFAIWLAAQGWDVTYATNTPGAWAPGVRIMPFRPHREPSPQTHPYAQPLDRAALFAQGFARAALAARREGYTPDVVVTHAGWGPGMFAREIFPKARRVAYVEWWYRWPPMDLAFLGETPPDADENPDAPMLERARNAPLMLEMDAADAVWCPTEFQASQIPRAWSSSLTVIHDGVDTHRHAPGCNHHSRNDTGHISNNPVDGHGCARGAHRPLSGALWGALGGRIPLAAPVVTYATRGMEPHRGFAQFMRALPAILGATPNAHVVIAGENRVFYGSDKMRKVDWRARLLSEIDVDLQRVHFVGTLDRPLFCDLLRSSAAHVYLTAPFATSWSLLEAMATGCAIVASNTSPVSEFVKDGEQGLLVDFFDSRAIAAAVTQLLRSPTGNATLRRRARQGVIERVDARMVWPRKEKLLREMISQTMR